MNVRALSWILIAGMMAAGCHAALSLGDLELVDETGSGGTGAGGSGTGTPTAVGGSGTGTPTGTGGGSTCVVEECPFEDNGCQEPICDDQDECVVDFMSTGTTCDDPTSSPVWVCDGDGTCVECNNEDHCEGSDLCVQHMCVPESCANDQLDPGETDVDCGGDQCPPCANGLDCQDGPDCASGFCDALSCAPCSGYADCEENQWCNVSVPSVDPGTCQDDYGLGAACVGNAQCPGSPTGFCVDRGVSGGRLCCDSPCDGPCDTCENDYGASQDGACDVVDPTIDPDPYNHCDGPCHTGACINGGGGCVLEDVDEPCGTPSCAEDDENSESITTWWGCTGAGACTERTLPCDTGRRCVNGLGGTVCSTDCADSHGRCYDDYWCVGSSWPGPPPAGSCQPDQLWGELCNQDEQCRDNNDCNDGTCCVEDCSGPCHSCNELDTGQTDGSCVGLDGVVPHNDTCNGYRCEYVINQYRCVTVCVDDTECHPDYSCDNSSCIPDRNQGDPCTRDQQCATGSCADGFCCDFPCVANCVSCDDRRTAAGNGTCAPVIAGTDPDGECGDNCCDGSTPPNCTTTGGCPALGACSEQEGAGMGDCNSSEADICGTNCYDATSPHSCAITCDAATCQGRTVQCPEGFECIIECGASDTVCQGSTLVCPTDQNCTIKCNNGGQACNGAQILCPINGTCYVDCGPTECADSTMVCGNKDCEAQCQTSPAPMPEIYCPPNGGCICASSCN